MTLRERIEDAAATAFCSFNGFCGACLVVMVWAALGPHYAYSDTWQLVINTGTTIVTFLMVFLVGANQRRADAIRQQMLALVETHTAQWERHAEETHQLIRELHSMDRRVMVHLGLIEAEVANG